MQNRLICAYRLTFLHVFLVDFLADRAKQIKTSAKINEDPTAALIRELQEENEKLKEMLASGKVDMSLIQGEGDDDMTEEGRVGSL